MITSSHKAVRDARAGNPFRLNSWRSRRPAAAGLLGLLLGFGAAAHADTGVVTFLHSFDGGADGLYPYSSLIPAGDGSYLGTTIQGGTGTVGTANDGTIFKVAPDGTESVLHSFSGSDGQYPASGLTLGADGNFYGTTPIGGVSGFGSFFKVSASGQETPVGAFTNGGDGGVPTSPLVLGNDGNFYGISTSDPYKSGYSHGLVYKITPAGLPAVLYAFSGGVDGGYPQTLIKGSDGNFYGTTLLGGYQ